MPDPTATDSTTPPSATPSSPVKTGWKTSEFWLNKIAILLSALFATNVIPTASVWMKVAMIAAIMLGSLGYTVSRTMIKTAAMLCLVAFGLHASSGCGWTKAEAKTVETTAVDCTKGELGTAVKLFSPMLDQLIVLATGGDGHLDTAQLESGTKQLAGDIGGCVLTNSIAKALKPAPVLPGAPKSSPLVIDPGELRAFYETKRAALGGKTYVTEQGPL